MRSSTKKYRLHLDELAAESARRGATPEQARLAARRAFGGVEPMKEQHRDGRAFRWIEDTWRDMRYAVRMLRRDKGLAAIAVITLALGVGETTALFSVIDALMLRRLPVTNPDELQILPIVRGGASSRRQLFLFALRGLPGQSGCLALFYRGWERQPDAGGHGWERQRVGSRARPGSLRQLLLGPQSRGRGRPRAGPG